MPAQRRENPRRRGGVSSSAGAGWPFSRRRRSISSDAAAPEAGNSSPIRSQSAAARAYTWRTVGRPGDVSHGSRRGANAVCRLREKKSAEASRRVLCRLTSPLRVFACWPSSSPRRSRRSANMTRPRAEVKATRAPRAAAAAVLHRAARARRRGSAAKDGEPLVDLGRGNPEVGPPRARRSRRLSAAAADERAHGYPPFRGLPELKEAIAARYRDVYGVELDPEREVAVVPGTKTALVELCLVLAERGVDRPAPRSRLPGLRVRRSRSPDATLVPLPLDEAAGWTSVARGRPPSTSTTPRTPARPSRRTASSPRRSSTPREPAPRRPRLRLRRPRLRRARAGELPRHARREGGRRRDVLDVEDVRDGGLAARVRRRQRRDRRADQPAARPHPRRDLPRRPGGGDRGADRAAGVGRGAARALRGAAATACSRRCRVGAVARAPSTSGSSCRRA